MHRLYDVAFHSWIYILKIFSHQLKGIRVVCDSEGLEAVWLPSLVNGEKYILVDAIVENWVGFIGNVLSIQYI